MVTSNYGNIIYEGNKIISSQNNLGEVTNANYLLPAVTNAI